MRIGYGYMRGDTLFRDEACDKLFLDVDKRRAGLAELLDGTLRLDPGDVIVVYQESDLGKGPALKRVRDFFASKGVTIEVFGRPLGPTKKPPQQRGIPYEALVKAQPYWHLPGISIEFINDMLRREGNKKHETWGPYARHQFIYALGNQSAKPRKLTPPTDTPLEDTDDAD